MSRSINHVFYLDDDQDDHDFFSSALSVVKSSAILHSYYKCSELLDYLKAETEPLPDIIFLDQNILGNGDNECLITIRTIAILEMIPVVVYTTTSSPKLVEKAMHDGAYMYAIKPSLPSAIRINLNSIIYDLEAQD